MSLKRVSIVITGIVFIGAIAWATAATAAQPFLYSAWKKITISQGECMQHAAAALSNSGFTKPMTLGTVIMLANRGDFSAQVRCESSNLGIVLVIVAGPSNAGVNYVNSISNAF